MRWYDKTVLTTTNWLWHPDPDEKYLYENGFIEPVYGPTFFVKGFALTEKAKELVRRRAGLRLVNELLSRINRTVSSSDMREIVYRVPFSRLPVLLACGDSWIRTLAARRVRKREFFRRM